MIGKAVSLTHKKYNVIILAGGAGSRMGVASDYLPKALTRLGELRAIDFIIERYSHVAKKFIIGVGYHSDLLMSYISGRYQMPIEYSHEEPDNLRNNCYSALYCLDHADSRYGTIIVFCDLIMLDNLIIEDDSLYYVSDKTEGNPGTFRHSILLSGNRVMDIQYNATPVDRNNGLLGVFVFSNTAYLKAILYSRYEELVDFTDDAVSNYLVKISMTARECSSVFEFGNEDDLTKVREMWRNV
jgi:NDP-sugar pyrophosphorylase family protein